MIANLWKIGNVLGPKTYIGALINILLKVQFSAMRMTPVDTGYLQSSARSELLNVNKNGAVGIVHYLAPYASKVHKEGYPFLLKAVEHEAPDFAERLGAELKGTMFKKDMA